FYVRGLDLVGFLRHLHDPPYMVRLNLHAPADLVARGLPAVLLHAPPAYANELVYRLDHMHRSPDRTSLVGNCTRNRLANPPRCVRAELEALAVIELFDGANKADVSLLD